MDISVMTSAMTGSRGRARHPRRAGRLPPLVLLAFVVLSMMNRPVKVDNEPDPPGDADEASEIQLTISSFDDLPDERADVCGAVMVMGDVVCSKNRVRNTRYLRRFLGFISVVVKYCPHYWCSYIIPGTIARSL